MVDEVVDGLGSIKSENEIFAEEINADRLVGVVGDDIGVFQLLSSQWGGLRTLRNCGWARDGFASQVQEAGTDKLCQLGAARRDEIISRTDDGIVGTHTVEQFRDRNRLWRRRPDFLKPIAMI